MKGALAEAIYFPAQCRKVSLVLIFQRRLCVPYSAIMGGMRRMQPAWTNGVKGGVVSRQKAIIHHFLKSICVSFHLFFLSREFPSFGIYILFALLPFSSCWVFLFACSRLPPLPLFPPPCAPPPPPPPSSPLFLCSFCSSEVYWISADSWNAEDKRGALAAPLWEMVLHRGWVSGGFVYICVCVRLSLLEGEGNWCRGYRQRKWGALCFDVSPERRCERSGHKHQIFSLLWSLTRRWWSTEIHLSAAVILVLIIKAVFCLSVSTPWWDETLASNFKQGKSSNYFLIDSSVLSKNSGKCWINKQNKEKLQSIENLEKEYKRFIN